MLIDFRHWGDKGLSPMSWLKELDSIDETTADNSTEQRR